MTKDPEVRPPSLIDFNSHEAGQQGDLEYQCARGQNFDVTLAHARTGSGSLDVSSSDELIVIVQYASVSITGTDEAHTVLPRSVSILPAGSWRLELSKGSQCTVLRSVREARSTSYINANDYTQLDSRAVGVGAPCPRVHDGHRIRSMEIDAVKASKDKPRLKMLRSSTLSINWVEYEGARDRTALSPHAHSSFEQGSLALSGEFVHHLRVAWSENADIWQDDRHPRMGSPSLLVVPVGMIHTSEGVGSGRHLLIDIFSPPRTDFIEKGWVFNADDYTVPA